MEIQGITGTPGGVCPADTGRYSTDERDIELKTMAEWAINYLMRSPKPQYNYQPVFQVFPLRFPSVREENDPVVDCDTDARMDWEWYYMRDIVGDERGRDVEEKFHARMRGFIDDQGHAIAHGGCYREDLTDAVYSEEDLIIHPWGMSKILQSLSEEYIRTQNPERLALATSIYGALKELYIWGEDEHGPYCYAPNGMGPIKRDGGKNSAEWNTQPNPVVGPLVVYYQASGNRDALDFAAAAANGIIYSKLPTAIHFFEDGSFGTLEAGQFQHGTLDSDGSVGHTHATLHAVWGIGELGLVLKDKAYISFVKRTFDWMMTRGTGTGWFPAMPDNCNETCAISDMISCACLLGRAGYSQYFDYAERFFRNYIVNLQFALTPEMEAYYRRIHSGRPAREVEHQLELLKRMQGAIIGGSGINDLENTLLEGVSGFSLFGCCAPEGMRAIHTIWRSTAVLERDAVLPDGLYINMPFTADTPYATVVSLLPQKAGMKITCKASGRLYVRVAHWAEREAVVLTVNGAAATPTWGLDDSYLVLEAKAGDSVGVEWPMITFSSTAAVWKKSAPQLEVTFTWEGNRVVGSKPDVREGDTPLFGYSIRQLPKALPY